MKRGATIRGNMCMAEAEVSFLSLCTAIKKRLLARMTFDKLNYATCQVLLCVNFCVLCILGWAGLGELLFFNKRRKTASFLFKCF